MDRSSDKSQHSRSRKGASSRSRHHENGSGSQKHTISYLLNDKSHEEKPDEVMRDVDISAESNYHRARMTSGSSRASSSSGRMRASRGHSNSRVEPHVSRVTCSHCNQVFSSQSELEEQCVGRLLISMACRKAIPFFSQGVVLTNWIYFCFPLSFESAVHFVTIALVPFSALSACLRLARKGI